MGEGQAHDEKVRSAEELLTATGRRDRAAFAELYDRFAPRLLGLIMALLGDRQESEDLLQEVFGEVWSRADRYDALLGSPESWLTTLARFRAIDQLRRRPTTPTGSLDHERIAQIEGAPESSDGELARHASEGLAMLPDDQRDAIKLAYLGGLTIRQIADLRGIPLGTAKTRIRLGMEKLREFFRAVQESLT